MIFVLLIGLPTCAGENKMEKCSFGKSINQSQPIENMLLFDVTVWSGSYGGERVVPVGSCVAEVNANFVHRHWLDLFPARDSNQQLVQLQLVSASTGSRSRLVE